MSAPTTHLFLDDDTIAEQRGVTRTWHPLRVDDEIWVYYSGRSYRHKEYRAHLVRAPACAPSVPSRERAALLVG